jgi:hypothetical protein
MKNKETKGKKTLVLNRETIDTLEKRDLQHVVGGLISCFCDPT